MMTAQPVMRLDELWDGELKGCELRGQRLLLARVDGRVYAYDDRCPHLAAPLSRGTLEDGVLTCSMHHWQFDLRSGRGVNPSGARLCPRAVTIRDGQIWVDDEIAPKESVHVSA